LAGDLPPNNPDDEPIIVNGTIDDIYHRAAEAGATFHWSMPMHTGYPFIITISSDDVPFSTQVTLTYTGYIPPPGSPEYSDERC